MYPIFHSTCCDHCRIEVPGFRALPKCTVCERDTCNRCDVPELRADKDTICRDCLLALHSDSSSHPFEAAGDAYPESLYCRICGASETAHER